MANESLDQYKLREAKESAVQALKDIKSLEGRFTVLEQREAVRDVKMIALKASADRNSALVGAMIVAIVGAALGVFFGVGR
jgi:uncharacterized protein YcfJ